MTRFIPIAAAFALGAFVVSLSPIVAATPAGAATLKECRAKAKEEGLKGTKYLRSVYRCRFPKKSKKKEA